MTEFIEVSQDVLHTAQDLIQAYHPALRDARIGFVFRDTAAQSAGKLSLAQASKINPKLQVHLDLDFLIWIARDFWMSSGREVREALLDHELCHCDWNNGQPRIRPHDIEEFAQIIGRRGFWSQDLFSAAPVFQRALQLDLPDLSPRRPGGLVKVEIKSFANGLPDDAVFEGFDGAPEGEPV